MPLYRVTIPVTLETYALIEPDAVDNIKKAIRWDTRIAAPEPGSVIFGEATVTINPDRQ